MEDPGVRYFTVDLHHDLVFFILDDAVCNLRDGKGIVSHQHVNQCVVTFFNSAHKLLNLYHYY